MHAACFRGAKVRPSSTPFESGTSPVFLSLDCLWPPRIATGTDRLTFASILSSHTSYKPCYYPSRHYSSCHCPSSALCCLRPLDIILDLQVSTPAVGSSTAHHPSPTPERPVTDIPILARLTTPSPPYPSYNITYPSTMFIYICIASNSANLCKKKGGEIKTSPKPLPHHHLDSENSSFF
jgi:hypothetical protein